MDHIAIEAIIDLMNAVIRAEVTREEMDDQMDEAAQVLADLGISDSFVELVMDFAESITVGLTIELEEV